MLTITKVHSCQEFIYSKKLENKIVGFVPTMGALHAGHISLIERAKRECDIVVASIFVNPTQFNDPSDFEKYPRMEKADRALLEMANCDVLFLPTVDEMYQNPVLDIEAIDLGELDTMLEGAMRPGHYQGVTTVVEKLFRAVVPHRVYLGLKDFQQVKVIEKLVKTRSLPIQIIGCPTLREPNGLAMSSRNMRLTATGREQAADIYRALAYIQSNLSSDTPRATMDAAKEKFLSSHHWRIEYLELRDSRDLSEINLDAWDTNIPYVALFAGWLEGVRLIDNLVL